MDGRTDRWTDGWMDGYMDTWIHWYMDTWKDGYDTIWYDMTWYDMTWCNCLRIILSVKYQLWLLQTLPNSFYHFSVSHVRVSQFLTLIGQTLYTCAMGMGHIHLRRCFTTSSLHAVGFFCGTDYSWRLNLNSSLMTSSRVDVLERLKWEEQWSPGSAGGILLTLW